MYYTQLYPSARDSSKMTDCTVEESKDQGSDRTELKSSVQFESSLFWRTLN